ncbi:dihydrofolate reductase family protein [Aeromicrobium sp. NPDC092404]|uniref:dihydrofolate reductase family protein n=1 Tax=Aeromicrobium sp. NPDC092404 TaxID=3154976 RepID=UPI00341BB51A
MATIYYTATSLDGYLATTDHSLDWLFEVPGAAEAESGIGDFMAGIGALVMGSSTYDWLLEVEKPHEKPGAWQESFGERPSWVFTHRDLPAVPHADIRFTQAPVDQVHAEMTAAAGDRDIWLMGGGDLVGQFDDAGLLDRVMVSIAPVTLGAGAPLLPRDIRSDRLTLTGVSQVGQFAELSYDVKPKAAT